MSKRTVLCSAESADIKRIRERLITFINAYLFAVGQEICGTICFVEICGEL